jgi:hypothetical protein
LFTALSEREPVGLTTADVLVDDASEAVNVPTAVTKKGVGITLFPLTELVEAIDSEVEDGLPAVKLADVLTVLVLEADEDDEVRRGRLDEDVGDGDSAVAVTIDDDVDVVEEVAVVEELLSLDPGNAVEIDTTVEVILCKV